MKIELSIAADYVPEWSTWEGIREVVCNARDAEVQYGAGMTVHFEPVAYKEVEPGAADKSVGVLSILSMDVVLDHDVMLMGVTSKTGRADLIGHRGEGLKLGCLALVRAGFTVRIYTGDQRWTPMIVPSKKFKRDVLAFEVKPGYANRHKRTKVEIHGLHPSVWDALKQRFRFLSPQDPPGAPVATDEGTLLLDPVYQGQIYVKGIWVEHVARLSYGYDFKDAELDRDRKMVAEWDRHWKTARIWKAAASMRPDLLKQALSLCEHGAADVQGFDSTYLDVPKELAEAAAKEFVERFGKDAVPVKTLADSQAAADLGRKGIVVTPAYSRLLAPILPSLDKVREEVRDEIVKRYSWDELTEAEQAVLAEATDLFHRSAGQYGEPGLTDVEVAEFRSLDCVGLHKGGVVYLRRDQLVDRAECLATLIHERSHESGPDGSREHVAAIERRWTEIARLLWSAS